jgi:hypothetical protein
MRAARFLVLGLLAIAACDCEGGGDIRRLTPRLELEPTEVDFGEVSIGAVRESPLTIKNTGEGTLKIASARIEVEAGTSQELGGAPDEAFMVGAHEQTPVILFFSPRTIGAKRGTLVLVDDAGTETRVPLTGIGVEPIVVLESPGPTCGSEALSLSFGQTPIGSRRDKIVQLRNTGSAPVAVRSVDIMSSSNEWSVIGMPAPATVTPGSSLAITIAHAPADVGADTATLRVMTDVGTQPTLSLSLCAEGTAPAICVRPSPIDLGRVIVGQNAEASVRLEACGSSPVEITAVEITRDPAHPSDASLGVRPPIVPQTIVPGSALDAVVTTVPTAAGAISGFLRVAADVELFIPITGLAVEDCELSVMPARLVFTNVAAGASDTKPVLLANDTPTDCTLIAAAIGTGQSLFSLPSPPSVPVVIGAGSSLTVDVRYAPTTAGATDRGTVTFEAGRSTKEVELIGNPPPEPGCALEVAPSMINFGLVSVGGTGSQSLTLRNVSMSSCDVTAIEIDPASSAGFAVPATTLSIAAGQSAQVPVTFTPAGGGMAQGNLHVRSNDTDQPTITVPLAATGNGPQICVTPRRLSFGAVTGSRDMSFTIEACGTTDVTVTGLPWVQSDAQLALLSPPMTPFTIRVGNQQPITVRYTPVGQQGANAAIEVRSNDMAAPTIRVDIDGGPQIVPPTAGRFLYYWTSSAGLGGDIMRLPLQGTPTPTAYWGSSTGQACAGCHALSPDGRYLALVESSILFSLRIVDTTTNQRVPLRFIGANVLQVSWRPNVNTQPPYQFAFDNGQDIMIASVTGGLIGPLNGANGSDIEKMPSWGPNGTIAFVRGTRESSEGLGLAGTSDVMIVSENGGTPQALAGASGNNQLNYYPSFSPNGSWIAFTQSASGRTTYAATDAKVRIAPANGGPVQQLPRSNGVGSAASFPTWSADGTYLSFSAAVRGNWDIYFVPIDPMTGAESAPQSLTQANSSSFDHVARWSP